MCDNSKSELTSLKKIRRQTLYEEKDIDHRPWRMLVQDNFLGETADSTYSVQQHLHDVQQQLLFVYIWRKFLECGNCLYYLYNKGFCHVLGRTRAFIPSNTCLSGFFVQQPAVLKNRYTLYCQGDCIGEPVTPTRKHVHNVTHIYSYLLCQVSYTMGGGYSRTVM